MCHIPAAGLSNAAQEKAKEEMRLLQQHSGSRQQPAAWDELYLRARALSAEVSPICSAETDPKALLDK